ncbi:DUF2306 domain-containing protein [Dyadobacter luticola]|uniref:DUF2306 domain-containing protein n=1 Tax=Dyadobacter luticola TaxID=1979387 RepID=A0A5R9KYV5_9BACT|nr:DUF2306 domain-containing protein [Dyadobacter luticola]TLV01463.1 DUF2306 domain-containing protein [Dyadobacter luticola]
MPWLTGLTATLSLFIDFRTFPDFLQLISFDHKNRGMNRLAKTIRFSIKNIVLALLSLIGVGIVLRRIYALWPVLMHTEELPVTAPKSNSPFGNLDDIFVGHPLLTLIHILPALLFVILGPVQFSQKIRRRHPRWHRLSGRVFVICSSIIGLTGLWMSFFMRAIGGFTQAAATALFSVFFLIALFQAFRHIRERNIALHREWMVRVYAIGLAVATIRLVNALLFATSPWTGLALADFFGTGFWIGFVGHLIGAEVWINCTRSSARKPVLFPEHTAA